MSTCKPPTAYAPLKSGLIRALLLGLFFFLTGCGSSSGEPAVASPTSEAQTAGPATAAPATVTPTQPLLQPETVVDEEPNGLDNSLADQPGEPEIGRIEFALGVTEENQPVAAGLFFSKGITQVHALFDYQNMSSDHTWERVWYLNEREISRSAGPWTGPESGTFNYFINNGDKPLPAGNWLLEIYVKDELRALGVFVIDDTPAATAGADQVYRLAYTKCEGDHHNIYVADTNGRHEQLLVTRGAGPSWTPDNRTIFFYGEEGVDRQQRDGGLEYLFNGISNGLVAVRAAPLPAGIEQLRLFQGNAWKQATARWANVSPDGTMVAFDARPGGDYRIYFLGAGVNEQQYRIEIPGEQADWSPDSQQIVYRSGRDGKTGLWISDLGDRHPVQITAGGSDSFPAWSPDGRTITFNRDEGGNVDIYAVGVDGANLRRLTSSPGHDTLPAYTPDGEIIFRSARGGSWAIWKMKGDGSEQTRIISDACVGDDWAFSKMDVSF